MKIFFCFLGLFIFSLGVSQNKQTLQKEIIRNIPVSPNTNFEISSIYGDLNFEVWQKNEIEVRVLIEVTTSRVKYIEQYIEAISVSEILDSNQIRFSTKIDKLKLDNSIKNKKTSFKINYYIKHPVYLNVKLFHKFGNVLIDELSSNFYLKLDNGSAYINNLTADETKKIPTIELKYSKCVIKKAHYMDIKADFSNLNVIDAQSILLSSSFSNIKINSAKIIKATSRQDNINVSNVSKINLRSIHSNIMIIEILNSADIIAKHGVVSIKKITSGFTDGYFDVAFVELKIGLDFDTCLLLDAYVKHGSISLPKRANVDNYISLKDTQSKGTIGCISNYSGKLAIQADFSNVIISE